MTITANAAAKRSILTLLFPEQPPGKPLSTEAIDPAQPYLPALDRGED